MYDNHHQQKRSSMFRTLVTLPHETSDHTFAYPTNINTIRLPRDERIQQCKKVYRPSRKTIQLSSETKRQCFAEHFIEDPKLGTLEDLAAKTLSHCHVPYPLPEIQRDPLKLRQHYDSLDETLPLSECYWIPDQLFWKRVVLHQDGSMAYKKNYNWRRHGMSLKFVEELENCWAEFFPQEQMEKLALQIKDWIFEMHIRHLKSISESTFERMLADEVEEDEYAASASSSGTFGPESSQTTVTLESEATYASPEGSEKESEQSDYRMLHSTQSEIEWEQEKIEMEAREKELAEVKRQDHLSRRELRFRYGERPPTAPAVIESKTNGKKKKKKEYESLFDVSEDNTESNYIEELPDKRNIAKCLYKQKVYKYPDYDCHHINLSILGFFENLTILTIEFQGPKLEREFHPRHLKFSPKDIENLAAGLKFLTNLIIFRLRNSRMDVTKLEILSHTLIHLPKLETVDLGNDQLKDDCHWAFKRLVRQTPKLKHLELEGNEIGSQVLEKLAAALHSNKGKLEYLGLSQCTLEDAGFEALTAAMVETKQVKHLCLTGTTLSQEVLTNCVAKNLLRNHDVLKQIDLGGIHIATQTALDIRNALVKNLTVLSMDCRGSDMSFEMEADIELMLKRNRYVAENPYIGDKSKTKKDVEQFTSRIKNPILLHALAAVEKRKNCLKNMPNAYRERLKEEQLREANRLPFFVDQPSSSHSEEEETEEKEEDSKKPPFVYDPNSFKEKEFMAHVRNPGVRGNTLKNLRRYSATLENLKSHLQFPPEKPTLVGNSNELTKFVYIAADGVVANVK